MATYAQAAQANELIQDVARLNNQCHTLVTAIHGIRAKLLALPSAEQDVIRQAVRDQGYDDAEIVTVLGRWEQVYNTMTAQTVSVIPQPR